MIIIGIDNKERQVKFQKVAALGQHAPVTTLAIAEDLIAKGDYPEILDKALADYVAANGAFAQPEPTTLVLPDCMVTMDVITLPTMARRTMGDTFRTEYRNLYKNHEELLSFPTVINANKKTTTYLLTLIRKDKLQRFREVLAGVNLKLEKAVSSAAAKCEALTDQHARLHRDTYLFLDVMNTSSDIILYDKGRMFGFTSLPFGMNALPNDQVLDEYDLYTHDIADLAVINAREKAKAAKLTMAAEEENFNADVVLDNPEGATSLSKQELMEMAQAMQEETAAEQAAIMEATGQGEDDDDAEEEAAPVETAVVAPQGKRYVKKPRKLPAFMQRPIPETANGMVLENFRAFQMRVLNYARTCQQNDSLPKPDYIVVNLPQEYEFLIQMLNAQEDNGMNFRLLCADGHSNILTDIELHGATKANARGKNPIF